MPPTTSGFLTGQRVLILGGSAGIGLAVAQAAAAEGAVVVIASSQPARVAHALRSLPAGSEGYPLNLTDEPQIQAFFAQCGAFDHLVFTAGDALHLHALEATELPAARQAFAVRYFGALAAIKYALPYLQARGSVVLTSGIAAVRPVRDWAVGASLCGAMESLTRALAVELAPRRVNAVSPGLVRTELWADNPHRETLYAQLEQQLLVGYTAEASQIAQTYLYLLRQPYVTGQVCVVDGGYVLT
jgi:NAD(P)-dependent dehydrogenase (short-subunit alcohol dehydrogenase family)